MAPSLVRHSAVLAVVATGFVAAQPTSNCFWSSPNGTSFDLSAARLPAGSLYTVTDVRQPTTKYTFNVCGNVNSPAPDVCSRSPCGWCPARPENVNASAGWQLQGNGNICYRLGESQGKTWSFQLQDIDYPNKGVSLVYNGGDRIFCPNNQPRSLALQFLCHPSSAAPPAATFSTTVVGRNDCNYGIGIPSIVGCPSECRTGPTTLCNGHGVCGFNTDAKKSQCYCYTGFTGQSCDSAVKSSSALSAESIILIVVLIALAVVVGLVVFMFLKLRKLTVDPGAYDQLQGRFNELGMLA